MHQHKTDLARRVAKKTPGNYVRVYPNVTVWEIEINDRRDPLRWPRNTLYPQKLVLLRQEAAVARSA
jgi:hypothetical protein